MRLFYSLLPLRQRWHERSSEATQFLIDETFRSGQLSPCALLIDTILVYPASGYCRLHLHALPQAFTSKVTFRILTRTDNQNWICVAELELWWPAAACPGWAPWWQAL